LPSDQAVKRLAYLSLKHGRPHIEANGKWKMDEKLKSENVQKREQFSMLTVYFESNHSGQAGVENDAMLTTHLFRYTSECTIS